MRTYLSGNLMYLCMLAVFGESPQGLLANHGFNASQSPPFGVMQPNHDHNPVATLPPPDHSTTFPTNLIRSKRQIGGAELLHADQKDVVLATSIGPKVTESPSRRRRQEHDFMLPGAVNSSDHSSGQAVMPNIRTKRDRAAVSTMNAGDANFARGRSASVTASKTANVVPTPRRNSVLIMDREKGFQKRALDVYSHGARRTTSGMRKKTTTDSQAYNKWLQQSKVTQASGSFYRYNPAAF